MICTFMVIAFFAFLIWLWTYGINFFTGETYKNYLAKEVKSYAKWGERFVWLDFESFKSIFLLSPDSWETCGCYVKTLKLVRYDTGEECNVVFKKKRDHNKAIALFKKFKEEKDKRIASKKEIEDFSFFKEMVQLDINRKKKEAEREIEEANRLLDSLNER